MLEMITAAVAAKPASPSVREPVAANIQGRGAARATAGSANVERRMPGKRAPAVTPPATTWNRPPHRVPPSLDFTRDSAPATPEVADERHSVKGTLQKRNRY